MADEPLTQNEKDTELYKASLQAIFLNELEHDKIILGLSAAALGFFIATFQNTGKITQIMHYSSILALIFFGITILMILAIFIYNKKQLLSVIATSGKSEEIKELDFLDKTKYIPFALAIIMSVVFTLSLVDETSKNKGNKSMDSIPQSISVTPLQVSNEAFNGVVSSNQMMTKGASGIVSSNQSKPAETNTTSKPAETNTTSKVKK